MDELLHTLRETLKKDRVVMFDVRVRPNSPENRIRGALSDGTIKIDIAAIPENSKANAKLLHFIAELFAVPVSYVAIVAGDTSRSKKIRIVNVTNVA